MSGVIHSARARARWVCDGAREGGGAGDGVEEARGDGHDEILSVANSVSQA